MSYTVLARRYRSGTFDEVIGQDHVAQTLKKAIDSGRIAHAYLFCGTRGVGKTSMARILAKALNCRKSDSPTTLPCGKCESCIAIARGDDIDVIEIDAASNTGVDNIREVIENSQYRPASSRFKVYIIDEVHMLSKSAFNALLKTLEEPPSHVKFILATTEPEKVLPTILSRCQRYDFRNIPTREIAGHLLDICKKEKIKADEDALLMVAKAGAGSMRDSLSLLDRLLSVGEKHLTLEMVEQLLGLPKAQLLFDLAAAIGGGEVKAVLSQTDSMIQGGMSVDSLIAALVDHLRDLLIVRTCGSDTSLVEVPGLSMKEMADQAQKFDPVALTQDITILEELRRNIRQSQAGRALLDATLVRMTLADQFASIGELLARVDGNGAPPRTAGATRSAPAAGVAAQKKNEIAGASAFPVVRREIGSSAPSIASATSSSASVASSSPAFSSTAPAVPSASSAAVAEVEPASTAVADDDDALPQPGRVWSDGPKVSLATLMAQHRKAAASAPPPPPQPAPSPAPDANIEAIDPSDTAAVWRAFLALLMTQGPSLYSLLAQGRLVAVEGDQATLGFGPQHEAMVQMWERNGKKDTIRDALCKVLNKSVGVKFQIDADAPPPTDAPPAPNPVRRLQSVATAQTQAPAAPEPPSIRITPELVESLRTQQPLVKEVMDRLGGQVIKVE